MLKSLQLSCGSAPRKRFLGRPGDALFPAQESVRHPAGRAVPGLPGTRPPADPGAAERSAGPHRGGGGLPRRRPRAAPLGGGERRTAQAHTAYAGFTHAPHRHDRRQSSGLVADTPAGARRRAQAACALRSHRPTHTRLATLESGHGSFQSARARPSGSVSRAQGRRGLSKAHARRRLSLSLSLCPPPPPRFPHSACAVPSSGSAEPEPPVLCSRSDSPVPRAGGVRPPRGRRRRVPSRRSTPAASSGPPGLPPHRCLGAHRTGAER